MWSTRRTSSRSSGCGRRCARARARGTWVVARFTRSVRQLLGERRPQPLLLLRLRQGRRRRNVRPRDRGPRLRRRDRVAGRAVPCPARVRGGSPVADEARKRRERLFAVLDQAASFFERHLWEAPRGARARVSREPRSRRGDLEGVPARPLTGGGLAAKAREKGFTTEELRAAGLTNQRGNDYFPHGSCSRSPTRVAG